MQDLLPEAIKHSEVLKVKLYEHYMVSHPNILISVQAVTETEIEEQKQKEQEIIIKKVEEEKKWSTFLQKPARQKPKDKRQESLKPKVNMISSI